MVGQTLTVPRDEIRRVICALDNRTGLGVPRALVLWIGLA